MRIYCNSTNYFKYQRTSNNQTNNLFETKLQEKEMERKDEKPDGKKGELVTCKEGSYMRQYIVKSDGTKVLVSESKQNESETDTSSKYQNSVYSMHNPGQSSMNTNTKEALNFLNLNAGVFLQIDKRNSIISKDN